MTMEIDKLHAEAKANFTPAQEKLLDAIGKAVDKRELNSSEAIAVLEWWIKWERSQEPRG